MKPYRDINQGHEAVMSTLDPFQLVEFALHHLAQSLSVADGFSTHTHAGGIKVVATHVDTCDNRSGKVSGEVLIDLRIDPERLEELMSWHRFRKTR